MIGWFLPEHLAEREEREEIKETSSSSGAVSKEQKKYFPRMIRKTLGNTYFFLSKMYSESRDINLQIHPPQVVVLPNVFEQAAE